MSTVSNEAISLATKLAAQQLRKNQTDIANLKKTVTAQATSLENTVQHDRAIKIAVKLIVGEDVLAQIQEKAASLMREDLAVVEKAIDLGLTQGLKLGHVMDNSKFEGSKSNSTTNALIDFLTSHASNSEQ